MTVTRTRRRLPAFGRELMRNRDAGQHPSRIWVLAGNDWGRRPEKVPTLAVGFEWRPGATDWRVTAGVPVHVVDRGHEHLWEIAAEIGAFTAPCVIHFPAGEGAWPYEPGQPAQIDVADAAWAERRQGSDGSWSWPDWWSDEQGAIYAVRRRAYRAALYRDLSPSVVAA